MMLVGTDPIVVADRLEVRSLEYMAYLYMPIYLAGHGLPGAVLPDRLLPFLELILPAMVDFRDRGYDLYKHNIYVSCKCLHVNKNDPGNRPGWHVDGYGSIGDINYVWMDNNPTQYLADHYFQIPTDDDATAMYLINSEATKGNVRTMPAKALVRLNEAVVHRMNIETPGFRRFFKITFSKHLFRNEGNTHNYDIDYDWPMVPRKVDRNQDHSPC